MTAGRFHGRFLVVACAVAFLQQPIWAAAPDDSIVIADLKLRESAVLLRDMRGWKKPKKIVAAVSNADRLAWLREATVGSGAAIVAARKPEELKELIVDADALVGPCIADVIEAGAQLRWIQVGVVGVEDCMTIPSIRDGEVFLTNMQRVAPGAVAEHAFAMMLTLSRQMVPLINNQREGTWSSRPPADMVALEGKTLLIVGMGNVGREIARRAHAFRMRVIAIRRGQHDRPEFVEYIGGPDELSALVAEADFIVNSTPLTSETSGLFDAEIFGRMQPGALFFNVGRGGSVVTDDLVKALETGQIAGAGLDVVEPEPLPEDHPLWRMPNVVLTPHVADQSDLKLERSWIVIRENLRRFVEGGKLLSVVDVEKGY